MIISEKRRLWEEFRQAFQDLDEYLRGNDFGFRSEAADVAHVTLMFDAFLRGYDNVLSEEEKDIVKERIQMGIDRLVRLDQSHILCLYYFRKNYEENPESAIHLAQVFVSSIRTLFKLAPEEVPLESTVWNYFVRDIRIFTGVLVKIIDKAEEPQKGPLLFLLTSLVHSLLAIRDSLEKIDRKDKISELLGKAKSSLSLAVKYLLDLYNRGELKYHLDNSPGFVIFLKRVLKEGFSEYDGQTLETLEQDTSKRYAAINFAMIGERTKSLTVLGMAETREVVPLALQVSPKTGALSFLGNAYIRFENREEFLGVLPVREGTYEEICVDDVDSFRRACEVKSTEGTNPVPLKLPEDFVKNSFANIIGEQFVQKDWGGEFADLFTNRVELQKSRIPAAFMFKGRGLRTKLTLAHCGANGDQILRLFKLPARLFVVQHIAEIDPAVREFVGIISETTARQRGQKIHYCFVDGIDTFRVLKAYGKVDMCGTAIEKIA